MSRILSALRDVLVEDPSAIEDLPPADRARVAALLEANRLEALAYVHLKERGGEDRVSPEILAGWKLAYALAVGRSLAYAEALREALDLAASKALPVRLLRGTQLAFFAYPRPETRPLDDLELQTPLDSAAAFHRALKSLRFSELEDVGVEGPPDPCDGVRALPLLARDGVTLRVHRKSLVGPGSAPWDPFSDSARTFSRPRILKPEPLVVLLAEEAARRSFCRSLRTLVDLHVVSEVLRPSWSDVVDLAVQAELALETYVALALLGDAFGPAAEEGCLEELRARSGCAPAALELLEKLARAAVSLYPLPPRLAEFVERLLRTSRPSPSGARRAD